MSVRDYAINYTGKGGKAAGRVVGGGNAVLKTDPHALDGLEHAAPADGTRLDATAARHGLVPKLSGDATDALRGDGTYGPTADLVTGLVPISELPVGTGATEVAAGDHDHWHGAWSDATAYVPGDMVTLDGASWVCVLANTALMPMSPDYREAMVSTVPVGYWRLGEAVPGTGPAPDVMGANDGTYVGSPASVAGLLTGDSDTAVGFDAASSQLVDLGTDASLDLTTAVSIAAWVKATATGGTIFARRDAGTLGYMLSIDPTYGVMWFCGDGTNYVLPITSDPSILDGARHCIAGTRDGAAMEIYVDGVAVYSNATVAAAVGSMSGSVGAYLGAYLGLYSLLTADLDEPAIWDRAITPAEIAGLNAVGTGVAYWERIAAAAGSSGGGVTVQDEGTPLATVADTLDFVGAGVVASGTGTTKTITISGSSVADILDLPTAETTATKVLAPDGAGGVEFRAEAGGGGGAYLFPIDAPPGSPSAKDDEFGGTLGLWTQLGTLDVSNLSDAAGLWHAKRACSSEIDGIYQAVPAGYPYTITAKIAAPGLTAAAHPGIGIMLLDATPTAIRDFCYNQAGGSYYVSLRRYTNRTSFASSVDNSGQPIWPWIYLRLLVTSATSVTFSVSLNGMIWVTPANLTAINPTLTPAYFGLSVNDPVSACTVEAFIDWVRVT